MPERLSRYEITGVEVRRRFGLNDAMTSVADRRIATKDARTARIAAAGTPFAIVWMFAGIVLSLLIIANFSLGMLSSVRAFVGGESLWSKAQKDAVFHLQNYARDHNPSEIALFRNNIDIPLGDHQARLEMDEPSPNLRIVRQGLEQEHIRDQCRRGRKVEGVAVG